MQCWKAGQNWKTNDMSESLSLAWWIHGLVYLAAVLLFAAMVWVARSGLLIILTALSIAAAARLLLALFDWRWSGRV
jgi:hypothetical protein